MMTTKKFLKKYKEKSEFMNGRTPDFAGAS